MTKLAKIKIDENKFVSMAAEFDSKGRKITDTYATKEELAAAGTGSVEGGLFEIPISAQSYLDLQLTTSELQYINQNIDKVVKGSYVNVAGSDHAIVGGYDGSQIYAQVGNLLFTIILSGGRIIIYEIPTTFGKIGGTIPQVNAEGTGWDYIDPSELGGGAGLPEVTINIDYSYVESGDFSKVPYTGTLPKAPCIVTVQTTVSGQPYILYYKAFVTYTGDESSGTWAASGDDQWSSNRIILDDTYIYASEFRYPYIVDLTNQQNIDYLQVEKSSDRGQLMIANANPTTINGLKYYYGLDGRLMVLSSQRCYNYSTYEAYYRVVCVGDGRKSNSSDDLDFVTNIVIFNIYNNRKVTLESEKSIDSSKPIKKTINQSSSNIYTTANSLRVVDIDITANSHIDLYPVGSNTETFLSEHLVSSDMQVQTGEFTIALDSALPSTWSMYYIITEVQNG